MGTISGAHLVAKALKTEGMEAIFTLCGGIMNQTMYK